ncbi:hypothetical protein ACFX1X_020398 [Malus domestica]
MKRQMTILPNNTNNDNNVFHVLSDEIIFIILDFLKKNPIDKKSFSLVCKFFHAAESKHRKKLKPLLSDHLPKVFHRYPNASHIDLTLCSRVPDASLVAIFNACMSSLRSIDLSRSNCFSGIGFLSLAANCKNMVEIDLSNATELRDSAVAALAEEKNLERLWMGRCKMITDMGVGCIAVGCRKLRLINLKWCLHVSDLGVGLLAVKCKDLRSLDLSYLPITDRCLPSIFELQYLEDLVLEGCFSVDDDSLSTFKHGCMSLKHKLKRKDMRQKAIIQNSQPAEINTTDLIWVLPSISWKFLNSFRQALTRDLIGVSFNNWEACRKRSFEPDNQQS